jgi:hypothetical protein
MADLPETRTKRSTPNTTRAQKGLSLVAMIKATPPYIRRNARDEIVIKKLNKPWTKGGMRAIRAVAVNMMLRAPTPHVVTIIGLDAKFGKATGLKKSQVPFLYKQKRLQVDCDCEWFKFYCEYALWSHGASKIRRCNGEPPVVTNPSLVPMCCKHVYAILKLIKEHGF